MKQIKRRSIEISLIVIFLLSLVCCTATTNKICLDHAKNLYSLDQYTLAGEKHLIRDYPSIDSKGNIFVVVEIPTGTNAKWEVDKATGHLKWEFKKKKPRVVRYLGYPGNYGMIPRTILPKELGGDGDPLDVIVIGPAVPRGSVVKARLIGVLKMLDNGEKDDKLIAVLSNSPLAKISSIKELNRKFKGITDILEIWFSNYKGPGKIELNGFRDVSQAHKILHASMTAYTKLKSFNK
jgi:inorganic pyrophosphatase